MAKKPATQNYATDMDLTKVSVEETINELEVYISETTKLEMQVGAEMVARAQESAALAQAAGEHAE